jgi:hypothetical protein
MLTGAGEIVSGIDRCRLEQQLYFQNRNTNAIEEIKQDGLLLLKFSNSQSRKEFTLQGGYYRDYAPAVIRARHFSH